ncbi:MAG: thiol-activated cytolysin family protein [Gemmatimonadota bacterium]|nr:MAG: thiol-activated cytolysin family protein [Gemmatimonadota bacterium]
MLARRFVPFLVFLFVLPSCTEDREPTGQGPSTFEEVFASGGDFAEVEESSEVIDSTTTTEVRPSEENPEVQENWLCTTRTVDLTRAPEEYPLFDPNSEIIFPGNLIQGKSLQQATPDPIPVRRGPGTIVLTLMIGMPQGVSRTVPEVTLGSVYDAANDILLQSVNDTLIPARFSFTMDRVHSEEQLAVAANAHARWSGGSFRASLKFSTDREYNRFLVKLHQSFYTIAYELPTAYEQMFAQDVTPAELAQYVGPGNPAAFISSVNYGRIFYLLIESTDRAIDIEGAINATFNALFVRGGVSAKVNYMASLSNLKVKAFALGGDARTALEAVTADFDQLKSFLAAGGNIKTGVPISFVLRSVRQPDRIVKVALNTRYDVKDCVPMRETFGTPIIWVAARPEFEAWVRHYQDSLQAWLTTAGGVADHAAAGRMARDSAIAKYDAFVLKAANDTTVRLLRWRSLSEETANDAYVAEPGDPGNAIYASELPALVPKTVNGEMPAVFFGYGDEPAGSDWGSRGYGLRFFGGGFAQSDYTLTAVAKFKLPPYEDVYFIGGSTSAPYRMLQVGFKGESGVPPFGCSHYDEGVWTEQGNPPPDQWHVYTVTYSQTLGTSIHIDGRLHAWSTDIGQPLQDFLGAKLGNVGEVPNAGVAIAELIAYDFALNDDQRRSLEGDLMRMYKF